MPRNHGGNPNRTTVHRAGDDGTDARMDTRRHPGFPGALSTEAFHAARPRTVESRLIAVAATVLALLLGLTAPALADAPLIVLDRGQLPFDLGPGHPANRPSAPGNSPNAPWNSAGNTANSPSAWGNRPSNPANERRLIFTADGSVLGYYAENAGGVLNLFDVNGRRLAYRPARGTRSLFTTSGEWCGTVDSPRGGGMVLAVTPECARRFAR